MVYYSERNPLNPAAEAAVSYPDGLSQTADLISKFGEGPIFVAIYGRPDSGKSHLISEVSAQFSQDGWVVRGMSGQLSTWAARNIAEDWTWRPGLKERSVYLLHECSGIRDLRMPTSPEAIVQREIGMSPQLSVGIFSPGITSVPSGVFDVLISNTEPRTLD